jgi:hypothetical protein
MRIPSLIILALLAAALAAGSATASGAKSSGFFKTQNGKIYCLWVTSGRATVVCGIKNGKLKPAPTNKCRIGDPTGGWLSINARGRARVQACSGDAGPFASPKQTKVLAPGKTWSGGGMSCKATASGMTCRNKTNHGFTMTTPGPYKKF